MEKNFWISAWEEGRTNFHRKNVNELLIKYFPELKHQSGQKVLVPLCGKTKDMVWLAQQGLQVHGVEFYEKAIEEFFPENTFPSPLKTRDEDFTHYMSENLIISCGDFFKLPHGNTYDLIYDRAALVALPLELRKKYASVLKTAMRKGGKYLLIAYEYDQSKMSGPPFSVPETEIRELFEDRFLIRLLENSELNEESGRLSSVPGLLQKVYLLERKD